MDYYRPNDDCPRLGQLRLDARLHARDRDEVADVTPCWRATPDGARLEPAAVESLEVAIVGLRAVIRHLLAPRGIGLDGTVVLELPEGLVRITASGRRVTSRWVSRTPADEATAVSEVAECRVILLAGHRPRVARRQSPWIG